jgi:hypothetical protein
MAKLLCCRAQCCGVDEDFSRVRLGRTKGKDLKGTSWSGRKASRRDSTPEILTDWDEREVER